MRISLEDKLLEKYPNTAIGYLVAKVSIKKKDSHVEVLKSGLREHLDKQGINAMHPDIVIWRHIYEEDFKVKANTYRSSIEALLRRVISAKEIWNICNVVDLYNSCSLLSLLPMGGYDLDKITGSIQIRYAQASETFLGIGEREKIAVKSNQVVYADEARILCWLWNYKDSVDTCIDENSSRVLFCIDSFDYRRVELALNDLEEHLRKINCVPIEKGVLHKLSPQINLRG